MDSYKEFISWESASRDTIDVKTIYIDMVEDLIAGILLSQIIYWHLPSKNGVTKLRVQKEGHYWIAKKREDWWDEIRISPKQFDRASDILVNKGIIEKKKFKFQGDPVVHIRLKFDNFLQLLQSAIESKNVEVDSEYENMVENVEKSLITQRERTKLTKREVGNSERTNKETYDTGNSLTEISPENITKTPKENISIYLSSDEDQEITIGVESGLEDINKVIDQLNLEDLKKLQSSDAGLIDEIALNISEMATVSSINVNGKTIPNSLVICALKKLGYWHIERIIDDFKSEAAKRPIKVPKLYLQSMIYNSTMSHNALLDAQISYDRANNW